MNYKKKKCSYTRINPKPSRHTKRTNIHVTHTNPDNTEDANANDTSVTSGPLERILNR